MTDFDYRGSYISSRRSASPTTLPDGREIRRLRLEERDEDYSSRYVQEVGPYTVSRVIRDEKDWAPYRNAVPYSGELRTVTTGTSSTGLVGLGILLEKKDGSPWGPSYVKSMIPGMAGSNSGQIQVGDEVVSIDGQSTESRTLDDIKSLSLGQAGSTSTVVLRRGGRQVSVPCTRVGGSGSMPSSPGAYRSTTAFASSEYRPVTSSREVATSRVVDAQYDIPRETRVIRDPKDWAPYEGLASGAYPAASFSTAYPATASPTSYPVASSEYPGAYPAVPVSSYQASPSADNSFYNQNGKPLHYL